MIGGGFTILLLGSFSWHLKSGPEKLRLSGGTKTMDIATGMPAMDAYYRSESAPEMAMMAPSPVPPYYGSGGETAATASPKVIKSASLALEVKSSRDSAKMVADVATLNEGFVESSNVAENADGTVSGYVTIRIPESKFDLAISSLTGLALRVKTESVNGQDVTEQYTDLEARLKAAEAEEAQYLEILKKATNVQDILSVTQYLSSIRSQIESLQGQIKYLGNQTSYSTITVTLTEQANLNIPVGKFDLVRDMKQAGQTVILLGQTFLSFAIWFVIIGSAIMAPTVLILFLAYKLVRRIIAK